MDFVVAQTFSERLFFYYLEGLSSPIGAMAVVAGLSLAVLAIMFDSLKWTFLGFAIYCGTIGIRGASITDVAIGPLIPPFSYIASASQGILLGTLLLLGIAAVRPVAAQRAWVPRALAVSLVAFQVTIQSRQVFGSGGAEKAALAIPSVLVMLAILGMGMPRWLGTLVDVRRLQRAFVMAVALVIAGSIFLLVTRPGSALYGGRLFGTSANPQRIAVALALVLPFSFALLQDRASAPWSRAFHVAVVSLALVMIIGTGSRTGGLMALAGTACFFRKRLGAIALVSTLVGAVALGAWLLLGSELSSGGERIISTENSRQQVWAEMTADFLRSPLIGNGGEFARENSFLCTAASYGALGLVPLFLFTFLLVRQAWRAARYRDRLGPYAPTADLVAASVAQFLVSWTFEGALLGTLTEHIFSLYCLLALAGVVNEQIARVNAGERPAEAATPMAEPDAYGHYGPVAA